MWVKFGKPLRRATGTGCFTFLPYSTLVNDVKEMMGRMWVNNMGAPKLIIESEMRLGE
jgi:hypothetical protein